MPANDGTPRGWYSVLSPVENGIEIQHHALTYDYALSAQKMRKKDFSTGYADCLQSGLWPSLDVLPEIEKSQTGCAIDLSAPIVISK